MRTVGLTGGIGCGKSTVAAILREQGVPVLDLDQVAREVVAPGEPALAAIASRWPTAVVDGHLDRKALGAIIVADASARAALEAITHPRIWERMEAWLAARAIEGAAAAVVEAALMVETGSYRRYDVLVVVSCSPEVQAVRLAAREGYDAATVAKWQAAQMPLSQKAALADVVIENNGDAQALRARVMDAWQKLTGTTPITS
jgi:dephospho-CoA kinase